MRVLIIGSGGREHALADKIAESTFISHVFLAPGLKATEMALSKKHQKIKFQCVDSSPTDVERLAEFAVKEKIDLTVVGPEISLNSGIVDVFKQKKLLVFGPSQKAAQIECSKKFAKQIMISAGLPTAEYKSFTDLSIALDFVQTTPWEKMVIKCDGLAAGKGVVVCENKKQAVQSLNDFMKNQILGFNVNEILIEEYLVGPEVSVFAFCDGERITYCSSACDHKRLYNRNEGPNTGGMGVVSPAPWFTSDDELFAVKKIFKPVVLEMKNNKTPFVGVLFAGLMKTKSGFKVLEFNCRFGDPETQALMPLIDEDLFVCLKACAEGQLHQEKIKMKSMKSVHVVMASYGYPGTEGLKVRTGDVITGIDKVTESAHISLYFAGVRIENERYLTHGGRVLGVTVVDESFLNAKFKAYREIAKIQFSGCQYRTDIGENL